MPGSFILVPLDTSAVAERAVPTAAWLAGRYGLSLKLLYVLDEHLLTYYRADVPA